MSPNTASEKTVELRGDLLADDVRGAGGHLGPGLLQAHVPAGVGRPVKVAGVLLRLGLFAEAVISVALLHQQLGYLPYSARRSVWM